MSFTPALDHEALENDDNPRRKWFVILARLMYPHDAEAGFKALWPFAAMLTDYPDAAFTDGSMRAVCACKRRLALPAFDEFEKAFGLWWRDHRPVIREVTHTPKSDYVPPTPEEIEYVSAKMAMLRAELAANISARESARMAPRQSAPPKVLAGTALLALYAEAIAKGIPGYAERHAALKAKLDNQARGAANAEDSARDLHLNTGARR